MIEIAGGIIIGVLVLLWIFESSYNANNPDAESPIGDIMGYIIGIGIVISLISWIF